MSTTIKVGIPGNLPSNQVAPYLHNKFDLIRRGSQANPTRIEIDSREMPADTDTDALAGLVQRFSSPAFRIGIV